MRDFFIELCSFDPPLLARFLTDNGASYYSLLPGVDSVTDFGYLTDHEEFHFDSLVELSFPEVYRFHDMEAANNIEEVADIASKYCLEVIVDNRSGLKHEVGKVARIRIRDQN